MNGQARNTGCRVRMMAPTIASDSTSTGIANHHAAPLVSQERDSTLRSIAPAVMMAIAGYSGST